MSLYDEAEKELNALRDQDLYRHRRILQGAQGPVICIDDQQLLNFSSNDYLGLANDDRVKAWFCEAVGEYGVGAGASQLVIGHNRTHHELEQALTDWLARDRALIFSSGYLANLAIASALVDKSTVVIQDKLNHASLIDAARLSRGRLCRYRHNDTESLKTLLEKNRQHRLVVMTDAVFSMDGDCAPLAEIASLCAHYGALLIVDDAHGLGVLGETGGGLIEQTGLKQRQVPLMVGTFGKAFGMSGAFIAGERRLIDLLLQKGRTYIYSTALLPAVAASLIPAVALVIDAKKERAALSANIDLFKSSVERRSVSDTHIQPLIIGESDSALRASRQLYEAGILAMAIRPPTVPKGTARLRLSITAAHERTHLEKLTASIQGVFA